MNEQERFTIARPLDLQVAVLRCQRSSLLFGASDLERSIVATIVSELGTNLLKYADMGTLEVRRVRRGLGAEVEITARDRGPGIPNLELAMTDHYSSGRTLGLGLPGVRRMADEFSIESNPQGGTTVQVRKRLSMLPRQGASNAAPPTLALSGDGWSCAGAVQPRRGTRLGGDRTIAITVGETLLLVVLDATGHGLAAHDLSQSLERRLHEEVRKGPPSDDPSRLLHALHEESIGTPGAAAAIAGIDLARATMGYLAVGNVRACVARPKGFRGVSRDGMLGRRWPTPFVQRTRLERGDHLLIWTDGLPEALGRSLTPQELSEASVEELAPRIVARFGREHDDAGLLMLRWSP